MINYVASMKLGMACVNASSGLVREKMHVFRSNLLPVLNQEISPYRGDDDRIKEPRPS